MRRVALILLSIATVVAADKDKGRFAPKPAASYPGRQTLDKITIAAVPYISSDQAASAFGKVNPYQHGILPVLVVIQNDTGKALRLNLDAQFVDPSNRHLDAMPAGDVVLYNGVTKAPKLPGTSANPFPRRQKKGPLNTWEIEGRAFSAKLVPPGESVSGFVYFEATYKEGSKLYVTGIQDAASGKDYFYYEIPMQ